MSETMIDTATTSPRRARPIGRILRFLLAGFLIATVTPHYLAAGWQSNLKIVGEGPERERLVHEIKKSSGSARINLPGATAVPEDSLRDFDIFVLSSDTEQAPLTVMEAMAAGLPVVATNVGDIADMVSPDNRAFITPCGDDRAYVEALSHLIQNPDARAALGAANRKKAKTEFDLAPMVENYRRLFSAVLV